MIMIIKNICFILALCFLTSCVSPFGKKPNTDSADKLDKKTEEMQKKKDAMGVNNEKKLDQIGVLAKGTHYALDKEPTQSKELDVAKQLNERVVSLAGNPDIKDVKRIQLIVDELISEVKKEREKGLADLDKLDKELQFVQTERDKLQLDLNKKSQEFENLSLGIAEENDVAQDNLDEMNKWFGLGAVWYGVKKFLFSITVISVILLILFLVLKMAAASNPIAGAIFGVFETLVGFVLRAIKSITPNSFSVAKFVPQSNYDKYKNALNKIVDTFEDMKEKNKVLPDYKKYKLEDILVNLEKVMDDEDKKAVEECLKELKWKI